MVNQWQESSQTSVTPGPASVHTRQSGQRIPIGVVALVLLGAVLLAAGAVISLWKPGMLVSPQDAINGAVQVYAGYTAARDAGLAIMLVALLSIGARRALGHLMALVGLIQLVDTAIDLVEHRWAVAPGVLVLGILFLVAATRLCETPVWKRSAWI
jgi:hypothetical protein